jgi:hypothetical protein
MINHFHEYENRIFPSNKIATKVATKLVVSIDRKKIVSIKIRTRHFHGKENELFLSQQKFSRFH